MYLTSVTQRVAQQSLELNDWVRVLNILAALNVGTLFGHVALSSKGQYSFSAFLNPDRSIQISDPLTVCKMMTITKSYHLLQCYSSNALGECPSCL